MMNIILLAVLAITPVFGQVQEQFGFSCKKGESSHGYGTIYREKSLWACKERFQGTRTKFVYNFPSNHCQATSAGNVFHDNDWTLCEPNYYQACPLALSGKKPEGCSSYTGQFLPGSKTLVSECEAMCLHMKACDTFFVNPKTGYCKPLKCAVAGGWTSETADSRVSTYTCLDTVPTTTSKPDYSSQSCRNNADCQNTFGTGAYCALKNAGVAYTQFSQQARCAAVEDCCKNLDSREGRCPNKCQSLTSGSYQYTPTGMNRYLGGRPRGEGATSYSIEAAMAKCNGKGDCNGITCNVNNQGWKRCELRRNRGSGYHNRGDCQACLSYTKDRKATAATVAVVHSESGGSFHTIVNLFAATGLGFVLYGSFKHYTKA